jgi:lipopolysaccharide/colanic/teichoic acid biosynthesis glycosyltransferase
MPGKGGGELNFPDFRRTRALDLAIQSDGRALVDLEHESAADAERGLVSPQEARVQFVEAAALLENTAPRQVELQAGSVRLKSSCLKRALDVCGALCGLLALAPLLLVIGLLIRLESPGPVLFRQWRTGQDGVRFRIYKLRTMRVMEDGASAVQATRNDRRVTPFGAFLRTMSIDELPQLFNVILGDMSLVGPRPHPVALDEQYSGLIANYRQRFLARPGLTGLAQVSGHRGETPNATVMGLRVDHDLEYIRNWSLGLDVTILIRTVTSIAFNPAAY